MTRVTAARNLKKESIWRRHVEAQAGSGQSVRGYCRGCGVSEQSFYWWRRELPRRDAAKGQPAFVPVEVPVPAMMPPGVLEIVLPGERGDRRVRVTGKVDRQMLADVLAVLEERQGRREQEEARPC